MNAFPHLFTDTALWWKQARLFTVLAEVYMLPAEMNRQETVSFESNLLPSEMTMLDHFLPNMLTLGDPGDSV